MGQVLHKTYNFNALKMRIYTFKTTPGWLSVKPQHYENTIAVHLVQLKAWSVIFQVAHFQRSPQNIYFCHCCQPLTGWVYQQTVVVVCCV